MDFQYRYVPFGASFKKAGGVREDARTEPTQLFENELVVDTGGVCWGHNGEDRAIIDHHFVRGDGRQFPSASAAVLHKADAIRERFQTTGRLWLVTHTLPDFDAFCSMFLARALLSGEIPSDGWDTLGVRAEGWAGEFDWFRPDAAGIPKDRRAAVLLAAYASCVDNCKRIACPRHRSLHSVLYAALARGRDFPASGAVEFFREAKKAIDAGLNPLFDSILESSSNFAAELAFLENEERAYLRDLSRARTALVFLQESRVPFTDWFRELEGPKSPPLTSAEGVINSIHLESPQQQRRQTDGVYIRDPECLLFKEWARLDRESSSMGEGFLFTAVAYSRGRQGAWLNDTDYYFAIDPERAGQRHLYDVWAQLQSREVNALRRPAPTPRIAALVDGLRGERCRSGFEGRAGQLGHLFNDPWFDGSNYECTIIATPMRGTMLGPAGQRDDLADDPVARLVQRQLEDSIYGLLTVLDVFRQESPTAPAKAAVCQVRDCTTVPGGSFRFAKVLVDDNVNFLHGGIAKQIGQVLWSHLEETSLPIQADGTSPHLIREAAWLGVWSSRGIVVAYKRQAEALVQEWENEFRELVSLAGGMDSLVRLKTAGAEAEHHHRSKHRKAVLDEGKKLALRVDRLSLYLASPGGRLLRPFFEATSQNVLLERIVSEHQSEQTGENIDEIVEIQSKVEWVEIFIVAVYGIELLIHTVHAFQHWTTTGALVFVAVAMLMVIAFYVLLSPKRSLTRLLLLLAPFALTGIFIGLGSKYKWFPHAPTPEQHGQNKISKPLPEQR